MTCDDPAPIAAGAHAGTDEVDVLSLAGQMPPEEGAWLLVTAADGTPGGGLSAQIMNGTSPSGYGGDVLVRLDREELPAGGRHLPSAFPSTRWPAGA
jgi:hypothetical protein